eukprot:GABV01002213.1.p1 GENE.GABV01002213.1~~GABV01002213.1.p1  ORF type:complete len:187 (+),score=38.37 GABV01002213.1:85-645(+)
MYFVCPGGLEELYFHSVTHQFTTSRNLRRVVIQCGFESIREVDLAGVKAEEMFYVVNEDIPAFMMKTAEDREKEGALKQINHVKCFMVEKYTKKHFQKRSKPRGWGLARRREKSGQKRKNSVGCHFTIQFLSQKIQKIQNNNFNSLPRVRVEKILELEPLGPEHVCTALSGICVLSTTNFILKKQK